MSWLDKFSDYLVATFSPEDTAYHKDVAAAQQAQINRQLSEGKIDVLTYGTETGQIDYAANIASDYEKQNSGVFAFLKLIPWWVWLALALWLASQFGLFGKAKAKGLTWLKAKL